MPRLFEEVNYNKFYTIRVDDKTRVADLCILDIYDSIVGCCGEVPRISPKSGGSVLLQVDTPDQTTLIENLMMINDNKPVSCISHETLNLTRSVIYSKDILRYSEDILTKRIKKENK